MHNTQIKIQENAQKGVSRTEAILLDKFWLLKRSIDIDGADLLIQERILDVDSRAHENFALVQVKFFENHNQVKIKSDYVQNNDGPRTDFFTFLHSDDENGDHINYFFTAKEIKSEWLATDSEYIFSINKKMQYNSYKNRTSSLIFEKITSGLFSKERQKYSFAVNRFFNFHVDTRKQYGEEIEGSYLFRIVEGCHLVFFKEKGSESVRPIDPRRDLYEYTGDFSWGYSGTGPQFLAQSLLGHYLGKAPNGYQINTLLFLISSESEEKNFELTTDDIRQNLEE